MTERDEKCERGLTSTLYSIDVVPSDLYPKSTGTQTHHVHMRLWDRDQSEPVVNGQRRSSAR